jgi:hypothetical protein
MKKLLLVLSLAAVSALTVQAQVLLSGGLTYSQNFDSLANVTNITQTPTWADNTTLVGWYASRTYTGGTSTAIGPYSYTTYRVGEGGANNGWIWSFGIAYGNSDRALGSVGSGTPKTNAFGVWIKNDTGADVNNILVSYTGEQWRNGGNTAVQYLNFSYKTFASDYSGVLDTVTAGVNGWVGVSALNFASPTVGSTAGALDGNATANRTVFNNIVLSGVTVAAGSGIFLRWVDIDDSGNDHGFGVDDLSVSFSPVPEPSTLAVGGCLALLGLVLRNRSRK